MRFLPFIFLLISSVAAGQNRPHNVAPAVDPIPNAGPLSAAFEQVELNVAETVVKLSAVTLDGFDGEISKGSEIESEKERKESAGLVRVATEAKYINVVARRSLFDFAEVSKVVDGVYLIRGPPGKYLVEVDTFDPSLGIERTAIPGVIGESEPLPPEVGDYESVTKLARELVAKLNDHSTQKAIVVRLELALESIELEDMNFSQATLEGKLAVERALSVRGGDSRYVDWLNGYRRPMQAEFDRLKVSTTEQYIGFLNATIAGLGVANSSSVVASKAAPAPVYEMRSVTRQVCDGLGRCRMVQEWIKVRVK